MSKLDEMNSAIEVFGKDFLDSATGNESNFGFVRPIIGKKSERGQESLFGTCTFVQSNGIVLLVTATHVFDVLEDVPLWIPDSKGEMVYGLAELEWATICTREECPKTARDFYDLTYALVDEEALGKIGPNYIPQLRNPFTLPDLYIASVSGFPQNLNSSGDMQKHGVRPGSYRLLGRRPTPLYAAPYVEPKFLSQGRFTIPLDRTRFGKKKAIRPHGLSGGPALFLGDIDQCMSNDPDPSVIGFLIEHNDRTGTATFTDANLLINMAKDRSRLPRGSIN